MLAQARRRVILPVKPRFQVAYRSEEGAPAYGDDEIDGVEVRMAAEAPSQVGPRVDRCVEFLAERAEESQVAVADSGREIEMLGEKLREGYLVAKTRCDSLKALGLCQQRAFSFR